MTNSWISGGLQPGPASSVGERTEASHLVLLGCHSVLYLEWYLRVQVYNAPNAESRPTVAYTITPTPAKMLPLLGFQYDPSARALLLHTHAFQVSRGSAMIRCHRASFYLCILRLPGLIPRASEHMSQAGKLHAIRNPRGWILVSSRLG